MGGYAIRRVGHGVKALGGLVMAEGKPIVDFPRRAEIRKLSKCRADLIVVCTGECD